MTGTDRIGYVCSPYGQQWVGMGRGMFREEPAFRAAVEECSASFEKEAGWSLVDELFLDPPMAHEDDVGVMQPLVFAVQVGLAGWLAHHGVRPTAVAGHSLGELAACVIAGILDAGEAARLVHHYSDQQRRLARPDQGMAVIQLSVDDLTALLPADHALSVAALSGPHTTVLAGTVPELTDLCATLRAAEVESAIIKVNLAGHSAAVDAIVDDLRAAIGTLHPRPGSIPMISSVTGTELDWRDVHAAYFARNLRMTVRLTDAIAGVLRRADVLVEISAHPVVQHALQQCTVLEGRDTTILGTMRRGEQGDDRAGPIETLEALTGSARGGDRR